MAETRLPASVDAAVAIRRIAVAALLAVALGLIVQTLVLAAKLVAGDAFSGVGFALDLVGGVAWSTVVCLGATIGVSLLRARALIAGLFTAVFAPLAVAASKAANQIVAAAIGAVGKPAAGSLVALAGVKALEYGVLGFMLAALARRGEARASAYFGTGLAVGILFGGAALALRAGEASAAQLAATAVNEIAFPAGCAAVVYVGLTLGRALKT